ncbi:DnaJ domain protein, partial [Ostertagia ostertagi]
MRSGLRLRVTHDCIHGNPLVITTSHMSRRLLVSIAPGSIRGRQFASEPVVDYYAVLGVKPGATSKEIKAAFYDLSKKYHPDRNRDNQAEAASKFHQVSLAYEILGSDEKRKCMTAATNQSPNCE